MPARGDLRLSDLAADAHRRGALRAGADRRAATAASTSTSSRSSRRCRWRSAPPPPARAPTRRPRARACSTWPRRSTTPPGSGLPIVMTVANRAIGAPINIWNDHSDTMSQRDSGWIQLYAETNQEALDLHIQAFRLAEELSLPVMVCMDGFILTHAFERVDMPDAGAGRRLPAAVRAAPGARPGRPGDDRRDGRPGGVHRGAGTWRTPSRCRRSTLIPEIAARVRGAPSAASSGGLRPQLPHRGRRDDRRRARLGARHDRGRRRRAARRRRERSARSAIKLLPAVPARRGARGARRTRSASWCSRRRSRSGSAASCRPNVRTGALGRSPLQVHTVIAGLGGRAITEASLQPAVRRRVADRLEPRSPSSTSTAELVERELARARRAPLRPARREHPARHRRRRCGSH